jgi:hypothetical protein
MDTAEGNRKNDKSGRSVAESDDGVDDSCAARSRGKIRRLSVRCQSEQPAGT